MLVLDTQHNPGHIGTVDIFQAKQGEEFDYEGLLATIRARLNFVPRYRMRIRSVPGSLADPVWVEDEAFDLSYHVRRSALPRPGTMEQLREFTGRVLGRRLDRTRPLWEMYLVEGLEGDRIAVVAKSHQCLIDGIETVDLGQVLLDERPEPDPEAAYGDTDWEPAPEPRPVDLVLSALGESWGHPDVLIEATRRGITGLLGTAVAIGEAVGGLGGTVGDLAGNALRGGGRAPSDSPLAGPVSEQRRVATASMSLDDLRALRISEQYTVNDVVLAVIAGGLRNWLASRGQSIKRGELWALVPMSVSDEMANTTSLGSVVAPHLMALPVGEPNALMRLRQISFGTRAHKDTGRSVAARHIADIAGFAPSTLHALGVRAGGSIARKPHDLLITNAPGPQNALYAAGMPLVASYPVLPLGPGHQLSIGVTSYNGEVFFGLNGDRDAMSDIDVLASCLTDALVELQVTAENAATSHQPTRNAANKAVPRASTPATRRSRQRRRSSSPRASAHAGATVAGQENQAARGAGAKGPAARTATKGDSLAAAAGNPPAQGGQAKKSAAKASVSKQPGPKTSVPKSSVTKTVPGKSAAGSKSGAAAKRKAVPPTRRTRHAGGVTTQTGDASVGPGAEQPE